MRWNRLGVAGLLTVNTILVSITLAAFVVARVGIDWGIFAEAGRRVLSGGLYEWPGVPYAYRYSPIFAAIFLAITPVGYVAWSALHFVALLALPRRLGAMALVSWPFWVDVYNGNLMTFVFVAGALALAGSGVGTIAFLALALVAPRPLMLPLVVWILWKRPAWRYRFAAMFGIHALVVLLSGAGPSWIGSLISRGADDFGARVDVGPALLLGPMWIPVGLALGAWLLWKGRVGLASLAVSPYWLPPYLLMCLLEVTGGRRSRVCRRP